jgi:hypothetical protein
VQHSAKTSLLSARQKSLGKEPDSGSDGAMLERSTGAWIGRVNGESVQPGLRWGELLVARPELPTCGRVTGT